MNVSGTKNIDFIAETPKNIPERPPMVDDPNNNDEIHCQHAKRDETLKLIEELYSLIPEKIKNLDDESEAEMGRWANILSYVSENIISAAADKNNLVVVLQLSDIAKRAKAAMHCIANKNNGDHYCSKEMRHEILMDIHRVEDKHAKELLELTNGSPSMMVVLGVKSAAAMAAKWILVPIILYLLVETAATYLGYHGTDGLKFPLFQTVGKFVESQFGPFALIFPWVALAAFVGGLASVLTRLDDFEARRGANPRLLFTNAQFKPFMGMIMSFFVVCVLAAGLVQVAGINLPGGSGSPTNLPASATSLLLALGFLSGFSERFAGDVVGNAEDIVGKGQPKTRHKRER